MPLQFGKGELKKFRERVLCALEVICPGARIQVKGDEISLVAMDCPGYYTHPAGGNLLTTVLGPDPGSDDKGDPRRIFLKAAGAKYVNFAQHPTRSTATVQWGTGESVCLFAHELVHAYHDLLGSFDAQNGDIYNGTITAEEMCTCCAENQIRKEIGSSARECYGEEPIDCSDLKTYGDCHALPVTTDSWGCLGAELDAGAGEAPVPSGECVEMFEASPCLPRACARDSVDDPLLPSDWDEPTGTGQEPASDGDEPAGTDEEPAPEKGDESSSADEEQPPHGEGPADLAVATPDGRVRWACACRSDVPGSKKWTDLGEVQIPSGFGDELLRFGVFARCTKGGDVRVRLISPCTERCPSAEEEALQRAVEVARRVRQTDRALGAYSRDLTEILDGYRHVIVLERVTPFGGYALTCLAANANASGPGPISYGTFTLVRPEDRLADDMFIATAAAATRIELDAGDADEIVDVAEALRALPSRIGGDPRGTDGAVYFLTLRGPDEDWTRRIILADYPMLGFDSGADVEDARPGDRASWAAMASVVGLWRALVSSPE